MDFSLEKAKSGFLNPVNSTVDKLMSASNGLLCLKSTIFGALPNPSALLMGLAGMAAGMISGIVGSVTDLINKKVGQIIGSVLSPILQIEKLIVDITSILISTQDLLDKALNMNLYFKDKQDCANSTATMMNCLAQSAMNKLTSKVTMNIDAHIGSLTDAVSKEAFKADGAISSYINRQTGFVAKAQLQTKLLT